MIKIIGLSAVAIGMWIIGYLMGKYERNIDDGEDFYQFDDEYFM